MVIRRTSLAAAAVVVIATGWLTLVPSAHAEGPSMTLDVRAEVTIAGSDLVVSSEDGVSASLGDTIAYTFTITNTGDQDLNTFKVTADLLDARGITVTCPDITDDEGWLAPGGTLVCTADSPYTVTLADYGITDDPGDGGDGGTTDDPGDSATDDPGDDATSDPGDSATDDPGDGATSDDPGDGATSDDPGDGCTGDAGDCSDPSDGCGGTSTDDPSDGTTDPPTGEPIETGCGDGDIALVLNATATAVARDGSPVTAQGSVTVMLVGAGVSAPTAGTIALPDTGA